MLAWSTLSKETPSVVGRCDFAEQLFGTADAEDQVLTSIAEKGSRAIVAQAARIVTKLYLLLEHQGFSRPEGL
jgi:hypothetical protein